MSVRSRLSITVALTVATVGVIYWENGGRWPEEGQARRFRRVSVERTEI